MVFGKIGDEAALVLNKLNLETQKCTDVAKKKSLKVTDKTFGVNIYHKMESNQYHRQSKWC